MSKRVGGSRVDGCSSSADPAQACRSRDRDGFPDGVLRRLALRRVQIPGVWRTTDPDDSSAVGAAGPAVERDGPDSPICQASA